VSHEQLKAMGDGGIVAMRIMCDTDKWNRLTYTVEDLHKLATP
jgi:hypothetical protein